jgi:DNA-binding beta-propeller fold protein YncE
MRETTSVMPLRCAPRARLMLLVTVLALFALCAGSAEAFSQRGFVFSEAASFGSEGVAAGQLSSPAGMAVSQSTGDVYVDDPGNHRVDEFGPHGEFIQAWGLGVIDGEKKLEVCTNETHCIKGLGARNLPGVIKSGGEIAVDNDPESPSFEDIYVEAVKNEEGSLIEKFNNRGELLDEIRGYTAPEPKATEEVFEEPHGIATGEHGELFVYNEEEVFEFNNATLNQGVRSFGLEFERGGRGRQAVRLPHARID